MQESNLYERSCWKGLKIKFVHKANKHHTQIDLTPISFLQRILKVIASTQSTPWISHVFKNENLLQQFQIITSLTVYCWHLSEYQDRQQTRTYTTNYNLLYFSVKLGFISSKTKGQLSLKSIEVSMVTK